MKTVKRFSLIAFLLAFTIFFSNDAEAGGGIFRSPSNPPPNSGPGHTHQGRHGQRGGNAGAPLDGGLLALLAAAGGAYVVKRRKKKNAE